MIQEQTNRLTWETLLSKLLQVAFLHNVTLISCDLIDSAGTVSGTRRKRCSDRFVKYPYPKSMVTNYKKEYHKKNDKAIVVTQKEAFNPEKEHKIINPHKMDMTTTNKTSY